MTRIEQTLTLSDTKFKRRIGTIKPVFPMLDILQTAHDKQHETGGKPPPLSVGNKLLLPLKYYREYTTKKRPCEFNDVVLQNNLDRLLTKRYDSPVRRLATEKLFLDSFLHWTYAKNCVFASLVSLLVFGRFACCPAADVAGTTGKTKSFRWSYLLLSLRRTRRCRRP